MTRFHDLRHTFATLGLKAGISPKVMQEMLGHSSVKITLGIYSHVMPGMHQTAAETIDRALTNVEDPAFVTPQWRSAMEVRIFEKWLRMLDSNQRPAD